MMLQPGQSYNPWRMFVGCFVPNAVARNQMLSPTAKLVFGRLCQYAGQDGLAFPSYRTLGCEVGVGKRQAMRAVAELESIGLLEAKRQERYDGGMRSNCYQFIWHPMLEERETIAADEEADIHDDLEHPHDDEDDEDDDEQTYDEQTYEELVLLNRMHHGDVTCDTPPPCHGGHPPLSRMSPEEMKQKNHIQKTEQQTVSAEVRALAKGTPLMRITDAGFEQLVKRHGRQKLLIAAQSVATAWQQKQFQIVNPGGYLQKVCQDVVLDEAPSSIVHKPFVPADDPVLRYQEERHALYALQSTYWESLASYQKDAWLARAKNSSPFQWNMPPSAALAIAREMAYDAMLESLSREDEGTPFADE